MLIGLPGDSLNLKVEIRSFPFCLLRLTKVHDLFISRFLGVHTLQLFNFLSTHKADFFPCKYHVTCA